MKRLLIASAVLALLTGVIWWSEKQEAAKQGQPDPKAPPKILALKEQDLTNLELQLRDQPASVLVRDNSGKWSLTAPAKLPGDQAAIQAVVSSLATLTADRVIDDNLTDLAGYGLESPAISLQARLKDGKIVRVRIGEQTPDGTGLYTSLDGDKRLFAIPAYSKDTFAKRAADLRDKHLLSFDNAQVSKLELSVAGRPALEFGHNAQNVWQIVRPRPMRADNLQVEEIVSLVQGAEMDTTVDEPAAAKAFASASPLATVRVTVPSGVQNLEIRRAGTEVYAKSAAGTFKGAPNLGPGVDKTLEDFQNKKLFDFGFDDPTKLTFKSKDEEKQFEKSRMDWVMNGRTMDSVSVQNMIDKFRDLSAVSINDGAIGKPEIELTVISKNGSRTEHVLIAPSGQDFVAQREKEPGVYRLTGASVNELRQAVTGVQQAADPAKNDNKK